MPLLEVTGKMRSVSELEEALYSEVKLVVSRVLFVRRDCIVVIRYKVSLHNKSLIYRVYAGRLNP